VGENASGDACFSPSPGDHEPLPAQTERFAGIDPAEPSGLVRSDPTAANRGALILSPEDTKKGARHLAARAPAWRDPAGPIWTRQQAWLEQLAPLRSGAAESKERAATLAAVSRYVAAVPGTGLRRLLPMGLRQATTALGRRRRPKLLVEQALATAYERRDWKATGWGHGPRTRT